MATLKKSLDKDKLGLALQRLELYVDPHSQQVLQELQGGKAKHLPQLSKELRQSPGQLKKQLDQLKAAGIVFSPKQYPKGYSVNALKCVKINLRARPLLTDD